VPLIRGTSGEHQSIIGYVRVVNARNAGRTEDPLTYLKCPHSGDLANQWLSRGKARARRGEALKKTIADDPPPSFVPTKFPNLAELSVQNFSTDEVVSTVIMVPRRRLTRKNVSSVFPVVSSAFDLEKLLLVVGSGIPLHP